MEQNFVYIEDLRVILQICVKIQPNPKHVYYEQFSNETLSTLNLNNELKIFLGRDYSTGNVLVYQNEILTIQKYFHNFFKNRQSFEVKQKEKKKNEKLLKLSQTSF